VGAPCRSPWLSLKGAQQEEKSPERSLNSEFLFAEKSGNERAVSGRISDGGDFRVVDCDQPLRKGATKSENWAIDRVQRQRCALNYDSLFSEQACP
jgi:hypothetical protein